MPYVVTKYTSPGHLHYTYRNMPKRSASGNGKSAKRTRYTRPRRRRVSRARPMRGLKTNYRSLNVYRFVRETVPTTTSFTLIPAGASFPAIGYLDFDNLQFNQLVAAQAEFGSLFARYKVDKIVTILTPLVQETTQVGGTALSFSAGLRITRVNAKWLDEPFTIQANSDAQLQELAQIQSKTVSNYASPKSLVMTTVNPGVYKKGVVDSTGAEIDFRGQCPWLNISGASNVPLRHNSILFAERTDGLALDAAWKYRVVHKVYFRCSQVG